MSDISRLDIRDIWKGTLIESGYAKMSRFLGKGVPPGYSVGGPGPGDVFSHNIYVEGFLFSRP